MWIAVRGKRTLVASSPEKLTEQVEAAARGEAGPAEGDKTQSWRALRKQRRGQPPLRDRAWLARRELSRVPPPADRRTTPRRAGCPSSSPAPSWAMFEAQAPAAYRPPTTEPSALHLAVDGRPQPAEGEAGVQRVAEGQVVGAPGAGVLRREPVGLLVEVRVLAARGVLVVAVERLGQRPRGSPRPASISSTVSHPSISGHSDIRCSSTCSLSTMR